MVIFDTNIVIDHLRTAKAKGSLATEFAEKYPKEFLALSTISVQELYEGKSTSDRQKELALLSVISPLKILPYTFETAILAGKIARDLKRPIELADAAIAATAIINKASLLTKNKKDFQGIRDLILL